MELELRRRSSSETCTVGELFVDGHFECYILEDVVREIEGVSVADWKTHGATAIPVGTYQITLTQSPRFKRILPLLNRVPGFSGVRIHPGNDADDTEGCLLPGLTVDDDGEGVAYSRAAFDRLFDKLTRADAIGQPMFITIENRRTTGDEAVA
jgi:hypothetical protein